MKFSLILSVLLFASHLQAKDLFMSSTSYTCTMFTAVGPARLVFARNPGMLNTGELTMWYGFLPTRMIGGDLIYSTGPNAPKIPATMARISSSRTYAPYMIFLQAAHPTKQEQILSGIIGYTPTLGLLPNPLMSSPFGNPLTSLGFVIPFTGFVPTGTLTCRIQFKIH